MAKCSMECKLKIVREYLAGKGSYEALSKQHKIASGHIKTWVKVEERIFQSMSRKGNCLDNSVMENFFGP